MRWKTSMQQYLMNHLPLFIFVSVLFLVGVVFGALLVNSLSYEQIQEINVYLSSFFHKLDQGEAMEGQVYFKQTFSTNLKWFLLIWVLGLSVIGMPFVLVLDFLKGVFIGFTVGYFISQMSWKGMLFAFLSIGPQNLFMIPAMLILSVTAISFSLHFIRNRLLQHKGGDVGQHFVRFSLLMIMFTFIVIAVSWYESYIGVALMERVIPILL